MLNISLKGANEGNEKILGIGKEPQFAYDNAAGSFTEEVIGTKYQTVLQSNKYQHLTIRVLGDDPLPQLTHEELEAANDSGTPHLLIFKDGKVKFDVSKSGWFQASASATGVEVASKAPASSGIGKIAATTSNSKED